MTDNIKKLKLKDLPWWIRWYFVIFWAKLLGLILIFVWSFISLLLE